VGLFESKKLYDNQIGGWIRDYLHQRGHKSTDEANELLAQYLGNDLPKVSNELDKLMLNVPNSLIISPEHVKTNIGISKEFNVFELQDALGRKDQTKAYQISEYFCANPKDNPLPMLVGSLYGYFSKLYMLSFLKNSTDKEIEAETGIRQFFLKNYKPVLQKYNRAELEKAIHTLAHYDLRSKGIAPAYKDDMLFSDSSDYDTLLTEMVIKIMNPQ
jgi:DNA polymerase-3 subunit delta